MLYAILCNDKKDHLQLRLDTRNTHLDYLNSLGEKLKFAGPFLDDDQKPTGSLIVIEAKDRHEAAVIAENDPYAKADLFETSEIRAWNWTINKPEHI